MREDDGRMRLETTTGEPVAVGEVTATPQSQALTAHWPRGGWVWNRPVAILVKKGGEEERVPIVDVTRMAQLALYAFSLAFVVLGLVMWLTGRRKEDE